MNVLIHAPAWVGDAVMANSLLQQLKIDHPDARLTVMAAPHIAPVMRRMAEVDEVLVLPYPRGGLQLRQRWQQGRQLRERAFDQAFILPRTFKTALIPFFARIPVRIGFGGELRSWLLTDARQRLPRTVNGQIADQTVRRYLSLGLAAGEAIESVPEPRLTIDDANRFALLDQLGLSTASPIIALAPGAEFGPAKQWPVDHYGELARQLMSQGKQVWVFGSPKDKATGEAIAERAPGLINLCGKTKMEDAIDLLSLADAIVANDSGLMHVGAAVGIHVVGLFGSTSPEFTPPLTANATILRTGIDCSPCFKRVCPYGHTRCLTELPVSWVMNALTSH